MRRDAGGFIIIIILCFIFLLVALPSTSSFPCHPDQRHALLRFKQSLSFTGPIVASWMEDEDCCSWNGIACDNSTGNVIGLDLTRAGLQGSINSSSPLFSLRHLRGLSLQGNDLLGSKVPPEIGVFAQLTCLNLSYSNISGILPTEISQLSKLVSLDLSGNFRPKMQDHTMRMLVSNLTQLKELNLESVNLSTVNPTSFMNLSSSLISLKLSFCWLSGNFPEFIFGLPNLQVIDTSENYQLTGTFPKSKWSPSLDYLSLRDCNFTGAVPNSIGNLSRLTYLDLSGNNLIGAIPNSIGNLSRLTYLDLKGNNLTIDLGILSTLEDLQNLRISGLSVLGEDANHGFSLPKLQELGMESCNLSKLPSFVSLSKELKILDLSGNNIREIPSWLWSIGIDTLEELYLYDNLIKGSIPPSICQLTSLSNVYLSGNYLTGIIPQCLGNLTKLQILYLSNNLLSGPLPTSLANCTSLEFLLVDNNNISGAPPTWLSTSSIPYIDLSDNKFEGPLPVPTAKTSYYSVSNNHFSGSLSSLLCNATELKLLDLSNNSLTGALPDCLENVTRGLVILNLRANEFHGKIPNIFHEASMLKSLDLSRNQFEGPLPRSLSHCKQLEVLDVGDNKIEDSFPNWLGDLPLKVLSLRSNHFHGRVIISKENHPFPMARIMDLSHNSFDGNLQDEFIIEMFGMTRDHNYDFVRQYLQSNNAIGEYYSVMIDLKGIKMNAAVGEYYSVMIDLKGVETEMVKINIRFALLDLSSNHFQGEIPKSIGLLRSLKSLNLSHNRFKGTIPPSVGNLMDLESLDLSSNHLTGEIPKELVKLTFLGFLDLSRNNLTGPIPLGGHFNTFSNSSFQGNPGLCGIPLTRWCGQEVQPPSEGKDGEEEDGGWLEWKYVVLGFGSGMGMGTSLGYMVLEMGRPLWLVRVVIRLEASYMKMSRRNGDQRRNGRR